MEGVLEITIDDMAKVAKPNDDLGIRMLEYHIRTKGLDWVIEDLFNDIDCTRLYNGRPITQTIDLTYRFRVGEILYLLNNYDIPESDNLERRLIETHIKNLEYEQVNPPVVYKVGIKEKKKTNKRKEWEQRQTKMFENTPTKRIQQFSGLKLKLV